jgi:hypothetical protein
MKLLFFSLILLGVLLPGEISDHKFYVSKCLIEYVEEEQSIQVTLHLFLDDLENALKKRGAGDLFLCTSKEEAEADSLVAQYIAQKLSLNIEGEPIELNFLGKEISDDFAGVWCYLEALHIQAPKKLEVSNKILTEMFDEQQNIVSIRYEGKKENYFLFTKDKYSETAYF